MKSRILFLALCVSIMALSCKNNNQEDFSVTKNTEETNTQTPIELGKSIFEGKGNCVSCHQLNKKVIGPSLQEIATTYKKQKGDLIAFLKEEAQPIVDPSQYEVMKANLALTKTFSDDELSALQVYISSQSE